MVMPYFSLLWELPLKIRHYPFALESNHQLSLNVLIEPRKNKNATIDGITQTKEFLHLEGFIEKETFFGSVVDRTLRKCSLCFGSKSILEAEFIFLLFGLYGYVN